LFEFLFYSLLNLKGFFCTASDLGFGSSTGQQIPGLVRPVSSVAPLQFSNNNNNSVHLVNSSSTVPAYPLPPSYGLNLSSKSERDAKLEVKDSGGKRSPCDEEASRLGDNTGNIFNLDDG